jgi:hypothetical protein
MFVKTKYFKFKVLANIPSAPIISRMVIPSLFVIGQPIVAEVICETYVPLTYQWYKNNASLGTIYNKPKLSISSLASTDAGTYFCIVKNNKGRTVRSISFTVKF